MLPANKNVQKSRRDDRSQPATSVAGKEPRIVASPVGTAELKRWYISHEIMSFEILPGQGTKQKKYVVWENLILIDAGGPDEAYQKALEHGRASEDQNVRFDGKRAVLKFKGLRDLVYIYDDLLDGEELEWTEHCLTPEKLKSLIRSKRQLHAFKKISGLKQKKGKS